ncbi:MAG: DNA/RNA nuclease SfsA [Deltaproteobacteria bacterium]|nr:DNA/RNA nuclease SfsA [Deltaproteobacteria bacterium]
MSSHVPIAGPLKGARFVDRPNQFLVRVALEPEEEVVTAHLPDPGRLEDLLVPGCRTWVRPVDDPARKTAWTAVLVQAPSQALVSLDTLLPNRLVRVALEEETIEPLAGWTVERAEVPIGRSRVDFLLQDFSGARMYLEVKSVTWVDGGVARFPDAPSERAARHVRELAELTQEPGVYATLLFIVQRNDAVEVRPAHEIDPDFARALREAEAAGVRIMAHRCQLTLEELMLGVQIPVVL